MHTTASMQPSHVPHHHHVVHASSQPSSTSPQPPRITHTLLMEPMTSTDHLHLSTTLTTTAHSPHAVSTHPQSTTKLMIATPPPTAHHKFPMTFTTHSYHHHAAHATSQLLHTTISTFSSSIPTKPTSLSTSSTI